MKTSLFCIMILLAGLFSAYKAPVPGGKDKDKDENTKLRFDGLYYKEGILIPGAERARNYTYLRFYPDGYVIRTSSASHPDQVAKWFAKKQQIKDGKGKYKLKNDYISFDLKIGGETISHEGDVMQDSLRLTVYASSSSTSYQDVYRFIKVDLEK